MLIEFKNTIKNLDKKFILIAGFHFILTFINDQFVFAYPSLENLSVALLKLIIFKLIILFVLIVFWQLIAITIKALKKQDRHTMLQFRVFISYFIVMAIFLILTWPGVWRWDELGILSYARNFSFYYWQHYLTSLYYILSFMIFPFPSGVTIIQLFIISYIVSFVFISVYKYLNGSKWSFLSLIPFFIPSIIDSNLYTLRATLYSYVFLYFLFKLYNIEKEKISITYLETIFLAFLSGVLIAWRSESIIFIVIFPIIFLFATREIRNKKIKYSYIAFSLMFALILIMPQSYGVSKTDEGDRYKITAMIQPLHSIVQEKYICPSESDVECFAAIDKVIDLDIVYETKTNGMEAFFNNATRPCTSYDSDEYNEFIFGYVKLVLNNFDIFIKDRVKLFLVASAMTDSTSNQLESGLVEWDKYFNIINNDYHFFEPNNREVRTSILLFLDGNSNSQPTLVYRLFYNILSAGVFLLVLSILAIIKKEYVLLFSYLALLAQGSAIFLTAPEEFFMYYLPIYLCGYVFMFAQIAKYLNFRRNNSIKKLH